MSFLKEYGFLDSDISEYENNTPEKMKKVIEEHENLVKVNLEYLKNLGIETNIYKLSRYVLNGC